ncbi:MAG: T9SS type A sorting domain-containing protein [Bacteroidia bacterium]|tara:strand:+ start:128 stop:919 length:792 start_codon:yes stop_codon:yes gene_type:complete
MKSLSTTLKVAVLAAVSTLFLANSGGSPGGNTGSAVDGGKTCATQGGCHAGRPILKQDMITTDIPATGYEPGKNYRITLNPTSERNAQWGYEMLVQSSSGLAVGSFTSNADGNIVSGQSDRITHKFNGVTSKTMTWVLDWTAPEVGEGNLQIFASVLAANDNNNTSGDDLIIDTLDLSENTTAAVSEMIGQEIVLYPNPVVSELHINGFEGSNGSISVFDMSGTEVISMPFAPVVNVRNLAAGNYILKIVNQNVTLNKTFVKR